MSKAPLFLVSLFFTAGILAAIFFNISFWPTLLAASLFCLLGFFLRRRRITGGLLAALLFCLGILRWDLASAKNPLTLLQQGVENGQAVRLTGIVKTDSDFECLAFKKDSEWKKATGTLRLLASGHLLPAYGEEVMVEGVFKQLKSAGNPGEFDYGSFLKRRGIDGILQVQPHHGLLSLGKNHASFFTKGLLALRQKALRNVNETLLKKEAALFGTMMLGDRSRLEGDLWDLFTRTGTVHLLSISGLHVGIFATLIYFLCKLLRLRKEVALFFTLFALLLYAVLVGGSAPVVRSTVMIALYLLGRLLGKEVFFVNTLSCAYLALLLWNPFSLYEVGFQLSFLSVFFLFLTGEVCKGISQKATSNKQQETKYADVTCRLSPVARIKGIAGYGFNLFLISVGIWVGTWPVVAHYFYVVSPVSWIANCFVIPLLFPIIGIGVAWLLTAPILPVVSDALLGVGGLLISFLIWFTKGFDRIPFGSFYLFVGLPFLFCYYIFLCGFLLKRFQPFRRKILLLALLLSNLWIWTPLLKKPLQNMEVTFLDVGHGDAIYLEFPGGRNLLIDGGDRRDRFDAGQKIIAPFLRRRNVRRLDAVLVTHADQDHIGGIPTVLETFRPTHVFENGFPKESAAYRRYEKTLKKLGIQPIRLKRGQKIGGYRSVLLEVLHPPSPFLRGTERDENSNGVVLKLTHGNSRFLFTADIEEEAIQELIEAGQDLRADILKMPHHGSDLGKGGGLLLSAVSPKVAVISVGEREEYHLPSPKTVSLLTDFAIPAYATVDFGAIRIASDGQKILIDPWRKGR